MPAMVGGQRPMAQTAVLVSNSQMRTMRPGECVIVALFLGLWGLSMGCGAVPSDGAVSTALPPEARQAGTQPIVKILYYEGEPRWEIKYLRRAVADDKRLRVSLLQRTAENKFLRLNVESADELAGGFPRTRSELFKYQGLILGSIEAGYFTPDQLQMIADFVNLRGGGLLMLGSDRSFAEGGYAGTPVADVLPVVLDPTRADSEESFFAEVSVQTTRAGASHPSTLIADTEEASLERWSRLPPVTVVNPISEVKPGATTLLTTPDGLVVLAFQRYGAGKSMAFAVQDSWLWAMHSDISPDLDHIHASFWRQTLHWLADSVPD